MNEEQINKLNQIIEISENEEVIILAKEILEEWRNGSPNNFPS